MYFTPRSLAVAALSASSLTSAMLIPAGMSETATDALTWAKAHLQSAQIVNIDCTSCPYALNSQRDGQHEWTNSVASDLQFSFQSSGPALALNGVPFYTAGGAVPAASNGRALPPALHVHQFAKPGQSSPLANQGLKGDVRLSYSLEVDEQKFADGNSAVKVIMTILALDGEMVKIDSVSVTAIKTKDGQLALNTVEVIPRDLDSLDSKCTNTLCRIYAKIMSTTHKAKTLAQGAGHRMHRFCKACIHRIHRLAGAKCRGKHHAAGHHHGRPDGAPASTSPFGFLPPFKDIVETEGRPAHFQPHPHNRHGGHHHNKAFAHRAAHVMLTAIRVVVIPTLIGIMFGMAASALGMLVGQLVVLAWTRFRRSSSQKAVETIIVDDEKVALMAAADDEFDEGLPPYEHAPAYIVVEKQ